MQQNCTQLDPRCFCMEEVHCTPIIGIILLFNCPRKWKKVWHSTCLARSSPGKQTLAVLMQIDTLVPTHIRNSLYRALFLEVFDARLTRRYSDRNSACLPVTSWNFKKILASVLVICVYLSVCLSGNSREIFTKLYQQVARVPGRKWLILGKSRSKVSRDRLYM